MDLSAQSQEKNSYLSFSPYLRSIGAGLTSYNIGAKWAIPLSRKLYVTPEFGFQWKDMTNKKNVYLAASLQYFIKHDFNGLYFKVGTHYDFIKYYEGENKKIMDGGFGYNFKVSPNIKIGLDAGVIMGTKEGEFYYGTSFIFNTKNLFRK